MQIKGNASKIELRDSNNKIISAVVAEIKIDYEHDTFPLFGAKIVNSKPTIASIEIKNILNNSLHGKSLYDKFVKGDLVTVNLLSNGLSVVYRDCKMYKIKRVVDQNRLDYEEIDLVCNKWSANAKGNFDKPKPEHVTFIFR